MSPGKRRVRLQYCLISLLRFMELRSVVIGLAKQEIGLSRSRAAGKKPGEYILCWLRLPGSRVGYAEQVECRGVGVFRTSSTPASQIQMSAWLYPGKKAGRLQEPMRKVS
jgi:hypothetical protein